MLLSVQVDADTERWRADNYSRNIYDQVYIMNIDLRNVTYQVCDDDEGLCENESIEDDRLQDLAHLLYENMEKQIRSVLPVIDSEELDSSKRNLVIDFKISSDVIAQDVRFLQRMLFKASDEQEQSIHLECIVRDADNKQEMIRFSDSRNFILQDVENPFNDDHDFDEVDAIFMLWAKEIQRLIR